MVPELRPASQNGIEFSFQVKESKADGHLKCVQDIFGQLLTRGMLAKGAHSDTLRTRGGYSHLRDATLSLPTPRAADIVPFIHVQNPPLSVPPPLRDARYFQINTFFIYVHTHSCKQTHTQTKKQAQTEHPRNAIF